MNRPSTLLAGVLLALGAAAPALSAQSAPTAVPAAVAAAVADTSRPEADRARDAARKPAEMLVFSGLKAGDSVVDLMPGAGYFTRVFSKVVGEKGTVYAAAPPRAPNAPANAPDFAARVKALAAEPGYGNVKVITMDEAGLGAIPKVDLVWTSLNYHDFHNRPGGDMSGFNKMVFDTLKPGGVFVVVDHAAAKGSGARDVQALHRIDPELVKQELAAAGFKLVGESDALRNPDDKHDVPNRDGSVQGRTDQFALKFQKPK